jgi:hypothetical protein
MPNLTKRTVDATKPQPGRDVVLWDSELPAGSAMTLTGNVGRASGFAARAGPRRSERTLLRAQRGHRTPRYGPREEISWSSLTIRPAGED